MEKPKCRLCGERHYGLCPVSSREAMKAAVVVAKIENVIPAGEPPIRREGPQFDRVTYQREYMRRYRARRKR